MNINVLNEINTAYHHLEYRQKENYDVLFDRICEIKSGWYNVHYHKDEKENWIRESYPNFSN